MRHSERETEMDAEESRGFPWYRLIVPLIGAACLLFCFALCLRSWRRSCVALSEVLALRGKVMTLPARMARGNNLQSSLPVETSPPRFAGGEPSFVDPTGELTGEPW